MRVVVSAIEAQTEWLNLLDLVARGERVTITKNGEPVAVLLPAETQPCDAPKAIAELREFCAGKRLEGISIRELIEQGRRS